MDAFLFYRVRRFDVKGGAYLQGLEKYYPADLGIKSMLLGYPRRNLGFAIETAVMLELVSRGYQVSTGKVDEREIDFIATRRSERLNIQVCASMMDEAARDRELAPFSLARRLEGENLVLTADRLELGAESGARILNVIDWMLESD